MQRATELAESHWEYVGEAIKTHGADEQTVKECKFHYITAFAHGYKHATEDLAHTQLMDVRVIEPADEVKRGCTVCKDQGKCHGGLSTDSNGRCLYLREDRLG